MRRSFAGLLPVCLQMRDRRSRSGSTYTCANPESTELPGRVLSPIRFTQNGNGLETGQAAEMSVRGILNIRLVPRPLPKDARQRKNV